ncbi:MAG: hypothetical protein EB170_07780 [Nitrosopumilaceae archaeon]|nr:hypothetical protein [Nitrosopumilaceae archaeon]
MPTPANTNPPAGAPPNPWVTAAAGAQPSTPAQTSNPPTNPGGTGSTPPTPTQTSIPPANPSTTGSTPPNQPPQQQTPTRWERTKSFVGRHLNKFLITLSVILLIGVLAILGKKFWNHYHQEDESTTAALVDKQIKKERDELRKQVLLQSIEQSRLTNEIAEIQKAMDGLADRFASYKKNVESQTNTSPSQSTNQAIQAESQKKVGSGIVTVNENHGDIKIIIKNGNGERSVITSRGPDKAEDMIPNLAESTGTESPITTDKSVPPGGNGIRYYLPKGWSLNYKYFCSQEDFEVFVNKGTREVPKWEAIDVSSDGKSESLWIRNISRRNVKFTFTLKPAE